MAPMTDLRLDEHCESAYGVKFHALTTNELRLLQDQIRTRRDEFPDDADQLIDQRLKQVSKMLADGE